MLFVVKDLVPILIHLIYEIIDIINNKIDRREAIGIRLPKLAPGSLGISVDIWRMHYDDSATPFTIGCQRIPNPDRVPQSLVEDLVAKPISGIYAEVDALS